MQWAQDKLAAYRSDHKITTVRDWNDDLKSYVLRCETCLVRVNPIANGYRHDAGELAELVVIAAGILPKIDWTIHPREIAAPNIEERMRVERQQALARARETMADFDERRRHTEADVEEANRYTEEEIVQIAHQSGLL